MKYRAVIFDMDGVLVDSELFYLRCSHRELVKYSPWITEEDLYPAVGMDANRTRILIHKLTGKELGDKTFDVQMNKIYAQKKQIYFPDVLYPEVPRVLRNLKERGFKIALASSSSMKNIRRMFKECNLASCFSVVISGAEFKESKPNPEIYCKTMEAIHCNPEECLIVEDSTYGIEAGAAAGAKVAARIVNRFPFDQSKASYFIRSLEDLYNILF